MVMLNLLCSKILILYLKVYYNYVYFLLGKYLLEDRENLNYNQTNKMKKLHRAELFLLNF